MTNPVPLRNWVCVLIENADIFNFSLDKDDMKILDDLDERFRCSWDPTKID